MKKITITAIAMFGVLLMGASTARAQTTEPSSKTVTKQAPRVTFEAGVTYWGGTSRFKESFVSSTGPVSTLTYGNMGSHSAELYVRVDRGRFFMKSNIGLGAVFSGQLHDEDWNLYGGNVPYSNTLSQINDGTISMTSVDIGENLFRRGDKRIDWFFGYNYYGEKTDQYGCTQLIDSAQAICRAGKFNDTTLISMQSTSWNSLRVGTVVESKSLKRLKVSAEVALMGTHFVARDNHLVRDYTTWFSGHGLGYGVQVEPKMTFLINEHLGISGGYRYWALNAQGFFNCTSSRNGGCGAGSTGFVTIEEYGGSKYGARRSGFIIRLFGKF